MRTLVFVGKIGPSFSHASISGYGCATIPIVGILPHAERSMVLDILFQTQASNVQDQIGMDTDAYVRLQDVTLGMVNEASATH